MIRACQTQIFTQKYSTTWQIAVVYIQAEKNEKNFQTNDWRKQIICLIGKHEYIRRIDLFVFPKFKSLFEMRKVFINAEGSKYLRKTF